jgi:hypothetical protein
MVLNSETDSLGAFRPSMSHPVERVTKPEQELRMADEVRWTVQQAKPAVARA